MNKKSSTELPLLPAIVPFWFWNGRETAAEITRQLELAKAAGLDGMAIHARIGNRIEYLSPEWLELVRHSCVEARRLGLVIWLYDEEGFPSGSVGGRLPGMGAEFRQKSLKFEYTAGTPAPDALAAFAGDDGSNLVFTVTEPGFFPYIDTLKRKVTDQFIQMTHEKYFAVLGEFFGDPITAIYTDDLNHLLVESSDAPLLSWTGELPEVFREMHGYDLVANLPLLIEDTGDFRRVRRHYRETVRKLFLDNFVTPMHQWCRDHGVVFLGHLSGDEGPFSGSLRRFTDAMAYYRCEDVPSIDDFLTGRNDSRYLSSPLGECGRSMSILVKQAASVADQFGNGEVSSESLTSLGWGVPVPRVIAQLNANLGYGVTGFTPHDYAYCATGVAKRDHPASFFIQQPYFQFHREIFARIRRSAELLRRGCPVMDCLVVHPMQMLWETANGSSIARGFEQHRRDLSLADPDLCYRALAETVLELHRNHLDYEFGHEEMMAESGSVSGKLLRLGKMEYHEVLIPDIDRLRESTVTLLRRFSEAGGVVSFTGKRPENCEFATPFAPLPPPLPFRCTDDREVLVRRRENEGQLEYFLVNFTGKTAEIILSDADYRIYDPAGDRVRRHALRLAPGEACHLLPSGATREMHHEEAVTLPESALVWQSIRRLDPNFLLIDEAELPDGKIFRFGAQPSGPEAGTRLTIRFAVPGTVRNLTLYAEAPEMCAFELNGIPIREWPLRHPANPEELRGSNLGGALRPGEANELRFTAGGGRLEQIYLAGDFSIRLHAGKAEMIPPRELHSGDAAWQGLPFYWGRLAAVAKLTSPADTPYAEVEISGSGVAAVRLNGILQPGVAILPGRVGMCNLRKGINTLELELTNTAQNFFGPHRPENCDTDYRGGEGTTITSFHAEAWEGFAPAAFGVGDCATQDCQAGR